MDTDAFDHIEPLAMTLQEIELERKILGYERISENQAHAKAYQAGPNKL